MEARILVAEDDRKQADLICRYLEREGYSVAVVHDGWAAIDAARQRRPDLLVLDVMMPRVDGLDVCRVLRAESDVPIVMLTARSTEDDMLLGLDLGADDYLTKPYSPRELVARVRTVLRRPDLLVLDVMMPRVDGLDVCRVLRAESDVPIVMLTARSTEDDMLLGLDLGADDYLTKPYSPRELVARVRTVLRRSRKAGATAGAPEGPHRIGELEVDPVRHAVRLNGASVECTPAEFRILAALIAEPGRAFSRAQLLTEAFGFDHYALDRTVDVHVMNLRRKIERKAAEPRYLLTVYGVGYKMAEEIPSSDAT